MEKLWAPWRIGYINSVRLKETRGCLFCKILKEHKDRKNLLLQRNKFSFSVLNKFPYNNGHIMVSPNRHLADIEELRKEEVIDLFSLISDSKILLDKVLKPQGYNIGINLKRVAGAGIDKHLHIHIVPRWLGDTNFMPITASTKVISQSLEELYRKLKDYDKKEEKR